jgi:hypothetical protein
MTDVQLRGFVVFVGIGVGLLALRAWADRSERGRQAARDMYTGGGFLYPIRNMVATGPLWASFCILLGVASVLPKQIGAWLWVPALAFLAAGFILAYRVPPPFRPRWMREEQEDGRLELARPDKLDWVLFWIVLPFALGGPIAIVALIVVYDSFAA